MEFSIRVLKTYEEMMNIHRLQQEIWGLDDPAFGMYPPVMNTAVKNGGIVLGAFDNASGKMVAFLFGFLGKEGDGPLKLCSQVMGVLPTWRRVGIAQALKRVQRKQVLKQKLPLITWTFDPLEGPNARLNLHKLRAISRRYWRDVYGNNFGKLNAGLPTDRLLVEWWVAGHRLQKTAPPPPSTAASIFEIAGTGVKRKIVESRLELDAEYLWLESVADIHPLKVANMALALDWRMKVRAAFEAYFEQGYIAVDFDSRIDPVSGERCNRYLLQKSSPKLLADIGMIS